MGKKILSYFLYYFICIFIIDQFSSIKELSKQNNTIYIIDYRAIYLV